MDEIDGMPRGRLGSRSDSGRGWRCWRTPVGQCMPCGLNLLKNHLMSMWQPPCPWGHKALSCPHQIEHKEHWVHLGVMQRAVFHLVVHDLVQSTPRVSEICSCRPYIPSGTSIGLIHLLWGCERLIVVCVFTGAASSRLTGRSVV